MHAYMHTYIQYNTYIHTYIHAYNTYIHTYSAYAHTYNTYNTIHTHIHTHVRIYLDTVTLIGRINHSARTVQYFNTDTVHFSVALNITLKKHNVTHSTDIGMTGKLYGQLNATHCAQFLILSCLFVKLTCAHKQDVCNIWQNDV